MHKLLMLGLAGLFLGVTGCQDTNTTGPLAGPDFHATGAGHAHFSFDMNDRFATEKGASGSGTANLQEGSVRVMVVAKGLLPNHDYELNVTIDFASVVTLTATSDQHGHVKFQDDLEGLAPGTYRLDFFVTHDHRTIRRKELLFPGLLNRDLLLACEPAVIGLVVP